MNASHPQPVAAITIGAIGEPGARAFYLQIATTPDATITLALEKTQALILADQIDDLLQSLYRDYPALPAPETLITPALQPVNSVLFRAGQFGLQYNREADQVIFLVTELRGLDQGTPHRLEVWVTRSQLRALSDTARHLVQQGIASSDWF